MAIRQELKSDAEHMALLDRLIVERGVDRYGLYLLSGEGLFTPDGYEETSGYVVSGEGCFFFWTSWDDAIQQVKFDVWQLTEPEAGWQDSQEYQAAREAAGLA